MNELAAIRNLTGLQLKRRAQGRLGGFNKAQTKLISELAERGIREVMSFCFVGRKLNENGLQIAMRRFVAVAWMLHSEMLVDEDENGETVPLSLRQLGEVPQLDCTKVALSLLAQHFGKQFKFQSRVQKRQGTKGNYSASAKTGWEKRRQRIQAKKHAAAIKRRARKKRTKK